MFVDACAIVSMMAAEDTADAYEAAPLDAARRSHDTCCLGSHHRAFTAGSVELRLLRRSSSNGSQHQRFGSASPVSPRHVLSYAVAVAGQHGIAKRRLSKFDCPYAYSKAMHSPRLTLDHLLLQTDVATLPKGSDE
ncbi:PIN domain-containing protein [Mesorhizobium sp. M0563]|uniref:PIN domain-containing protein n=1 Tax=Mesorhizobium sp. M0563 TaxID=2956959 RepID=UPI003334F59D